jgi:DNA-binding GntR family transcriptional regulator
MQLERSRPLYEQAYAALRTAILEGRIAPGERLVETKLAEMLNTSRTPIRESIRQLERDGLVTVSPHDGGQVRKPDRQDLEDLYLCRAALERVAAGLAAERADQQDLDRMAEALDRAEAAIAARDPLAFLEATSRFHRLIDLAARNERLDELTERARAPLLLYRALLIRKGSLEPVTLEGIHAEHLGVLAAVKSRDKEFAAKVMDQHMKSDLSRINQALTEFFQTDALS